MKNKTHRIHTEKKIVPCVVMLFRFFSSLNVAHVHYVHTFQFAGASFIIRS